MYAYKKEQLAELEGLAQQGLIELFYDDESQVCSAGYVPYGWQFPGEEVCIRVEKGFKLNCWGLISRQNKLHWATTNQRITAAFVGQQLDSLSLSIHRLTVVVLDNARVHRAASIQQMRPLWEARGLYLFADLLSSLKHR
ncbi:transposase [Spirosoma foliorum]|uniref:transposase n=1 Tax=Spirosoma foliorum TaxID=2710596 RepID=UPI001C717292|nr:transposase [Spirosoma foliorum]